MKKVTLKMIADAAGVSVSCVTRCINSSGYVSEKKREKVLQVMKDLNYIPNRQAKSLRGGYSKLLGFIYFSTDENIFFTKTAMRIERMSFEKGYTVISYALSRANLYRLKEVIESLLSYGVDGIIFNSGNEAGIIKRISSCIKGISVPVVMIERTEGIYEVEKVRVDNAAGSHMAVKRLQEAGHSRIAFLGVEQKEAVEQERYEGYVSAMREIDPEYARENSYFVEEYTVKNGYLKCLELLEKSDGDTRPTAIFAASDILAAGVYRALQEHNIRIPGEISVVGYDDTIAEFLSPPLSTMQMPVEEIAEAALEILIEKIEGNYIGNKTVEISPVFIQRSSICEISQSRSQDGAAVEEESRNEKR